MCPAGKYSRGDTDNCTKCAPGTYSSAEATACHSASPGYFVNETKHRTTQDMCPAGKYSEGGTDSCTACTAGRYSSTSMATACDKATPGNFVDTVEASAQTPCEAGHYSGNEAAQCNQCEQGKYQPHQGQSACLPCPHPLYTAQTGSLYCDACVVRGINLFEFTSRRMSQAALYWDPVKFQEHNNSDKRSEQCEECCVECKDACHGRDHDNCVNCTTAGVTLSTLDVKPNYWRATKQATLVYRCDLRGCEGGLKCKEGHTGALCGM